MCHLVNDFSHIKCIFPVITHRIKICKPQIGLFSFPEFFFRHFILSHKLIQCRAEKWNLSRIFSFRIIWYTINPDYFFPTCQFNSVHNNLFRNLPVHNAHMGKNGSVADLRITKNITILQICFFSYLCTASYISIMRCKSFFLHRWIHLHLPIQELVILHIFCYKTSQFPCCPEMNKFRRWQTQQLHWEMMDRIPDLCPAFMQCLIELSFCCLFIEIF